MQESEVVEAYVLKGKDEFVGKISLFEAIACGQRPDL
jgi:hypothetical protein